MTPCRHNHHGNQTGPVPNFRDSMAINVFILNWQTANCWDCWHPDCRQCTYLELIFKSFLGHYLKPSPDHLVSCGGGSPPQDPLLVPSPNFTTLCLSVTQKLNTVQIKSNTLTSSAWRSYFCQTPQHLLYTGTSRSIHLTRPTLKWQEKCNKYRWFQNSQPHLEQYWRQHSLHNFVYPQGS